MLPGRFFHFSAEFYTDTLLSEHAEPAHTGGSQMHPHVHAQMQVQLPPCCQTNVCWLPREEKSKQLTVIESLSPTCEQILISHCGDGVSLLISVLKGVCFLDAIACCSKNNFPTWCSITLPLVSPQKGKARTISMCESHCTRVSG